MPLSRQTPSRFGPLHCGQSSASREVAPTWTKDRAQIKAEGRQIHEESKLKRTSTSRRRYRIREYYPVELAYTFQVGGQTYTGHRITMSDSSTTLKGIAEKNAVKYGVGTVHPVYYNPSSPSLCLLEPGVTSGTYIWLGVGVVLLLAVLGAAARGGFAVLFSGSSEGLL